MIQNYDKTVDIDKLNHYVRQRLKSSTEETNSCSVLLFCSFQSSDAKYFSRARCWSERSLDFTPKIIWNLWISDFHGRLMIAIAQTRLNLWEGAWRNLSTRLLSSPSAVRSDEKAIGRRLFEICEFQIPAIRSDDNWVWINACTQCENGKSCLPPSSSCAE